MYLIRKFLIKIYLILVIFGIIIFICTSLWKFWNHIFVLSLDVHLWYVFRNGTRSLGYYCHNELIARDSHDQLNDFCNYLNYHTYYGKHGVTTLFTYNIYVVLKLVWKCVMFSRYSRWIQILLFYECPIIWLVKIILKFSKIIIGTNQMS